MGFVSKLLLLSAVAAGLVAAAPAAPRLTTVTYSGNGCPQGSNNTMSADGASISFGFADFTAMIGGPEDPQSRTRNCEVHINFDGGVPGYALAVKSISGQGTLYATPNVTATFYSTVFWSQNASNTLTVQTQYTSDAQRSTLKKQQFSNVLPIQFLSPCVKDDGAVGILNINFRVMFRSTGTGAVGFFMGQDSDPVTEKVEFAWVTCGQREVDFEG